VREQDREGGLPQVDDRCESAEQGDERGPHDDGGEHERHDRGRLDDAATAEVERAEHRRDRHPHEQGQQRRGERLAEREACDLLEVRIGEDVAQRGQQRAVDPQPA
jgi:hypothetical protein